MNFIKSIIHILSWICYVLIIVYCLICLPYLFKYKPLVVLSGSMEPTYKVNSIIYYHPVEPASLKKGDVITFRYDNEDYITHRIENIENDEITTKGDANDTPDIRTITYNNIEGKVADINIPYLGAYVVFINNHLYVLGIMVVILILEFIFNNFYHAKDKENQVDKKFKKDLK